MQTRKVIAILAMAALVLGQSAALMAEEKPVAKTEPAKNMPAKAPVVKPATATQYANTVAVCACGMVFKPTADTKYLEYDGKQYACCTEYCHQMVMKDPAGAAKMAEDNMAKVMKPMEMKTK